MPFAWCACSGGRSSRRTRTWPHACLCVETTACCRISRTCTFLVALEARWIVDAGSVYATMDFRWKQYIMCGWRVFCVRFQINFTLSAKLSLPCFVTRPVGIYGNQEATITRNPPPIVIEKPRLPIIQPPIIIQKP